MICVEESSEFVPHGRSIVSLHPRGLFGDLPPPPGQDHDESWQLRAGGEQELYSRESTVVWSVGGKTHKCYSLREPVLQALWTTFHSSPRHALAPAPATAGVPEEPEGEPLPSIVARDSSVLRVFTEQGQDFRVALQFAVRRCWQTKFGLLIEREVVEREEAEQDATPPVIFSLLHPLDDFTRVVVRQAGLLTEWTEPNTRLVFTSASPSLAVSYNSDTEQHSVWRVRRASLQEARQALYREEGEGSKVTGSQTPSTRDSLRLGQVTNSPVWLGTSGASPHVSLGASSMSRGTTPSHSRAGTPMGSRTNSPGLSSMANILRGGQSPSTLGKVRRQDRLRASPRIL